MENLALVAIVLCGFLAGGSTRINARSVPQRGPHHDWFIIAVCISAITIWCGIEGSACWFLVKSSFFFLLATPIGILPAWLFRKWSPMVED